MTRKSLDSLGQLQRAVIEVVWELGEANVHQVREQLSRDRKPAYTTVLSSLQKLEKAGWVSHRAEGKSYIYLPTRSREEAGARSLNRFVNHVFNGDPLLMFQHLIRESQLSDEDLEELRSMIDAARKERRR